MNALQRLLSKPHALKHAAEANGISQKVLKGWAEGKEPSLPIMRDVGIHFGVDSARLLQEDPIRSTALYDETSDSFFGHVGLKLPTNEVRWFPITDGDRQRLAHAAANSPEEWTGIQTLNNRILMFLPDNMKEIIFLCEAADWSHDDEWRTDDPHQNVWASPDFYRAVREYLREDEEFEDNNSPKLQQDVIAYVKTYGEEASRVYVDDTIITGFDGTRRNHTFDDNTLSIALAEVQCDTFTCLYAGDEHGGYEIIIPASKILLIDAPQTVFPADEDNF